MNHSLGASVRHITHTHTHTCSFVQDADQWGEVWAIYSQQTYHGLVPDIIQPKERKRRVTLTPHSMNSAPT